MRELYATTVQLVHLAGGNPFDEACEKAISWAWRVDEPIPDLEARPVGQVPAEPGDDEVSVNWWFTSSDSSRAFEITLSHPDGDDPTLRWISTVTVSELRGSTRATVRLGREAAVHIVRPGRMTLRAPSLVPQLVRPPLMAYAGSLELKEGSRTLTATEVSDFADDVLRAKGRALPIFLANSRVAFGFTGAVARAAAGLVQVVQAADDEADRLLLETLGLQTVPNGGARLYWPGFGHPEQAPRNPYWTASQIRAGGRRDGPSVVGQVVRMVAQVSTDRVPPDTGFMVARREALLAQRQLQREREETNRRKAREERNRLREAAKADRPGVESSKLDEANERLKGLAEDVAAAEAERDRALERADETEGEQLRTIEEAIEVDKRSAEIKKRAADLQDRVTELKAENKNLKENMRAVQAYEETGDELEAPDPVPSDVSRWEDIEEHLLDLEGPGFCCTQRACGCADGKSRYPDPASMWRSLRALERVGRLYNERATDLGMRFEQFAMETAGLDVALQDGSYGDEHFFQYEGRWYSRLPHVKIDDSKAPNAVGRIYFALDSVGGRIIVDWFGTKPDRPRTRKEA